MNKSIKKRLEKLAGYAEQGDIIFYHYRKTNDTVIIKDEWYNGE
ncbi:hypothetical protein ACS6Y5_07865 [Streptococcus suis]|nr:hypothetical protein [Streptococcus suis]